MINSQLLDYIRQQLAGAVSKEDIVKALLSNSWSVQDINEAFAIIEKVPSLPVPPTPFTPAPAVAQPKTVSNDSMNTIWTKRIPRTNKIFMVISLILVFGLDLFIMITNPSLAPFWYVMLGVLAAFAVFFYLENFVFRKKFTDSASSLDKWIFTIIIVRNLIFLLNFVPLIQILGMMLLGDFFVFIPSVFGGGGGLGRLMGIGLIGPAIVVLYIILVARRFSVTKQ